MGKSEDIQKRIEALNGGPLRYTKPEESAVDDIRRKLRRTLPTSSPPVPTPGAPAPILYRRDLPRTEASPPPSIWSSVSVKLEEAVEGQVINVPERGQAFRIETILSELDIEWIPVNEAFQRAFQEENSPLQQRLALRCGESDVAPEDVVFVDVETTGLGYSPLFLIGALVWEGGELVVRQYLARHYGEESSVTSLFLDLAGEKRMLVSFNGKSFDYPYIRMRAAVNAVPCKLQLPHFDLLHESRRIWRNILPNCKLQTLEQHICGRPPRYGDIPGAEIPRAYHTYVRTQNAGQLVQIIKHNLLDLATLAELITHLPAMEEGGKK
ncbi:MAG: ribonuclease H-like domain-containing protein [Armatimonadota bacterium]